MKKMISLLLTLAMLLTCAFAVSLAEGAEDAEAVKAQEMDQMMDWLSTQISEDEAETMLDWDMDTILSRLAGYEGPLTVLTKEEAAEQLYQTFAVYKLFAEAAESEDGEAIMGLVGDMVGEAIEDGDFTIEWGDDGDWSVEIVDLFNGTFWQSGDTQLATVFQDGYYKVAVTKGDAEWSYLCEYDEYEQDDAWYLRLTGIGTGAEELDGEQPDGGRGAFVYDIENKTFTWTTPEGAETVFTQIIDPLDGSQYFTDKYLLTLYWQGGANYGVSVEVYEDFSSWNYYCTLDEATDTLTGTGPRMQYGDEIGSDEAAFAFQNDRSQIVWTSANAEDAADGLTFEGIEKAFTQESWSTEDGAWFSCFFMSGYYNVQVFASDDDSIHGYLCTYDRANRRLVAVDPTSLDYEALNLYVDEEQYTTTGTFTLQDDDHLLWLDDAGAAGDGIVLVRDAR